jgi:hypothetical protein
MVQEKMALALNLLANSGAWWYSLYVSTKRKFKQLDASGRTPKQRDATAKLQQTAARVEICVDEEGDGEDLSHTNFLWKRIKSLTTSFAMQRRKY